MSRKSGTFSSNFPRFFRSFLGNPRTDPGNSHCLLEFSDLNAFYETFLLRTFLTTLSLLKPLLRPKKAHKLLTHKLSEKAVNPGTTSRSTRKNVYFPWFGGEHINCFCPVYQLVVPGSTGPSPEQNIYVYVPFDLPTHRCLLRTLLRSSHFQRTS